MGSDPRQTPKCHIINLVVKIIEKQRVRANMNLKNLFKKKDKKEEVVSIESLPQIWDEYAEAGYEKVYLMSCFKELQKKIKALSISCSNGTVLDGGCGRGNLFKPILEKIQPSKIIAVDWSEKMLKKAKEVGAKLANPQKHIFEFQKVDLTKTFPWPDNTFDAEIFNLSICYLTEPGWEHAIKEAYRTTKPGGYVYVSTLLRDWDFSHVIKKHIPHVLLTSPIGCFYGLKLKKHVVKIDQFKKRGDIRYPLRDEFLDSLKKNGFINFEEKNIFWGAALLVRIQKPSHINKS